MSCAKKPVFKKHIKYNLIILLLLLFQSFTASSQITVYPVQDFNFGTFFQGSAGGTIQVSTTGTRSATGDIILLNTGTAPAQAIFDIEAPFGSNISIMNGPDVILTGSNGGSITLSLEETDPISPFTTIVTTPERTRLQLAGTLIVGDGTASPAGNYHGTFSITVNQE